MNPEIKARFIQLSSQEKQIVLADLLTSLTLALRSVYDASEAIRLARMLNVNEAMHVISDKLRALIANEAKQYPDDVFLDILFEKAGSDLALGLQRAFDSSLKSQRLTSS